MFFKTNCHFWALELLFSDRSKIFISYCSSIFHVFILKPPHHYHIGAETKWTPCCRRQFSKAYSWIKMFGFRLTFHLSLLPRVQLTIFLHWFRYWLGAVKATSHYLNQWWLAYRRIYASFGLNELRNEIIFTKNILISLSVYSLNYLYAFVPYVVSWMIKVSVKVFPFGNHKLRK